MSASVLLSSVQIQLKIVTAPSGVTMIAAMMLVYFCHQSKKAIKAMAMSKVISI